MAVGACNLQAATATKILGQVMLLEAQAILREQLFAYIAVYTFPALSIDIFALTANLAMVTRMKSSVRTSNDCKRIAGV